MNVADLEGDVGGDADIEDALLVNGVGERVVLRWPVGIGRRSCSVANNFGRRLSACRVQNWCRLRENNEKTKSTRAWLAAI